MSQQDRTTLDTTLSGACGPGDAEAVSGDALPDTSGAPEDLPSPGPDGGAGSAAAPALELDPGAMIDALRAELAAANDRHLRTVAEIDNLRKRMSRESQDLSRYAPQSLARALFPVADTLAIAVASIPAADDGTRTALDNLRTGLEMVMRQFVEAFASVGIQVITARPGEPFNHDLHEAVAEEDPPADPLPPGSVLRVFRQGYRLHDRLLRPCQVVVVRRACVDQTA